MSINPKAVTYFLVALIVLVVIVAISFAFAVVYKKVPGLNNTLTGDTEIDNCLAIKNSSVERACLESVAVNRKDEGVCLKLTDPQIVNEKNSGYMNCLMAVATVNGNETLCKEKFSGTVQEWCLSQVAARLKKPEICDSLSKTSYRNQCYYNMAVKNKLTQYCDKINEVKDVLSDKTTVNWEGSKTKCQTASK